MNQTELTPQPMKQSRTREITQGVRSNNGFDNKENLLGSWKEIASYLDRTVRTVQRWEHQEQLPVHRHQHQCGVTVYAFKHEVDDWRNHRSKGPTHLRRFAIANHSYAAAIVHLQRLLEEAGLGPGLPSAQTRNARVRQTGRTFAPTLVCLKLEADRGNRALGRSQH